MAEAPLLNGNATHTVPRPNDFFSIIDSLPPQVIRSNLAHAAQEHPDVAMRLVTERHNIVAARPAECGMIDFKKYLEKTELACSALLNPDYVEWNERNEVELSAAEIHGCIDEIGQATRNRATFATKKAAFETLLEIGTALLYWQYNDLVFDVVIILQEDDVLPDVLLEIAMSLTENERMAFTKVSDKLMRLEELNQRSQIFNGLKDIIDALLGERHKRSLDLESYASCPNKRLA